MQVLDVRCWIATKKSETYLTDSSLKLIYQTHLTTKSYMLHNKLVLYINDRRPLILISGVNFFEVMFRGNSLNISLIVFVKTANY